jgi:hypothetical protein
MHDEQQLLLQQQMNPSGYAKCVLCWLLWGCPDFWLHVFDMDHHDAAVVHLLRASDITD